MFFCSQPPCWQPGAGDSLTPFLESDPVLGDVDEHFSGDYLNEMTILRAARDAGFGAIIQAGLGDLVANQPAAAVGDTEVVHQMRVAIRRLRAVLVLFEPVLDRTTAEGFEAELQRQGRVLGEARD